METLVEAAVALVEQTAAHAAEGKGPAPVQWSAGAKDAVVRVFISQIGTLALDLEAFAKHGKRTTVNGEDVKLALRRNPALVERMSQYLDGISAQKSTKKQRARDEINE